MICEYLITGLNVNFSYIFGLALELSGTIIFMSTSQRMFFLEGYEKPNLKTFSYVGLSEAIWNTGYVRPPLTLVIFLKFRVNNV